MKKDDLKIHKLDVSGVKCGQVSSGHYIPEDIMSGSFRNKDAQDPDKNNWFTFPEKGTITLFENGVVEKNWIDDSGQEHIYTDITRVKE